MSGFTKEDLPFIGSKTIFAAVMWAGRLMEEDGQSISHAAHRAAMHYQADEKRVARYVGNALIRASWRKRVPPMWRGTGQQAHQQGRSYRETGRHYGVPDGDVASECLLVGASLKVRKSALSPRWRRM